MLDGQCVTWASGVWGAECRAACEKLLTWDSELGTLNLEACDSFRIVVNTCIIISVYPRRLCPVMFYKPRQGTDVLTAIINSGGTKPTVGLLLAEHAVSALQISADLIIDQA